MSSSLVVGVSANTFTSSSTTTSETHLSFGEENNSPAVLLSKYSETDL